MKKWFCILIFIFCAPSFSQSNTQYPTPPTNEEVRKLFSEFWAGYIYAHHTILSKEETGATHNSWNDLSTQITIDQCVAVENVLAPGYLCHFSQLPESFFPDQPKLKQATIIKQPVPFSFENNRWQLKPLLYPPPSSQEIKTALDQIWLTEKNETISILIENRKRNPTYAPSPGYGLPNNQTDSDKQHQKRLKNLTALPDAPFAQHPLKINQCIEAPFEPGMIDFRTVYLCTINNDDLAKIFPLFAKSWKKSIKQYKKEKAYLEKIHASSIPPNPEKDQFYFIAIYHNNQWIIGQSNFDPLLATFKHIYNYDGCILPVYRPREWNETS